jgi:hypothetical protein
LANPTTNYGFVLPTSSDLVTDLPADFDVALQGVDTRLKALQPGTTLGDIAYSSATANTNTRLPIGTNGQVLGVSGGVPAWVSDASGMTNPMTTTGDMIYSSPGSTPVRRGIGTTGQVLAVSGGVPTWTTLSSGAVVQVKSFYFSTASTTTSTSYIDAGLSLSITPTSASNKILVMVSTQIYSTKSGAQTLGNTRLDRAGTILYTDAATPFVVFGGSGSKEVNVRVAQIYLDSPATTAATTYKLQYAAESGGTIGINTYSTGGSTITLMEVTP